MVADSSALILLAKCGLLEIVCNLFEIIVPKAVNIEVASEDLVKNYPDAALISDLISKGAIKVQSSGSDRLPLPISLHRGEEDALLLAIKLGRSMFATDDGKAIKAAKFFKVPFIITPKIVNRLNEIHDPSILRIFRRKAVKVMSLEKFEQIIDLMMK